MGSPLEKETSERLRGLLREMDYMSYCVISLVGTLFSILAELDGIVGFPVELAVTSTSF